MSIIILLAAVGGLLFLFFIDPFIAAADQRRVQEQRPGDVPQLAGNLAGCLLQTVLLIAAAILLGAIGLGWHP